MLQELQLIKEQLFDAPKDIKQSFNTIVSYFDDSNNYLIVREFYKGNPGQLRVVSKLEYEEIAEEGHKRGRGKLTDGTYLRTYGSFPDKASAEKKLKEMHS